MNYKNQIKKFVNSQQLYAGVRMTAAALIPAIILYKYNLLGIMMAVPLGALCVGLTDSPGPLHHRRNSLFAAIVINCIVVVITGYINGHPSFIYIGIIVFGLFFSLIGVYGSRINSIGLIALLVFIFNIDSHPDNQSIWYKAFLFSAGGFWYLILSIVLHTIRPFKLVQQLLGECLIDTAKYLEVKSLFYKADPGYPALYDQLVRLQVTIRAYHDELRELLYKTRTIVLESTVKGRVLMLMFMDSVDLFERIVTSQQDYAKLHASFDDTAILEKFAAFIEELSHQLQEAGLAIQAGQVFTEEADLTVLLDEITQAFLQLRKEKLSPDNIENFIMLRQILYSLQDITERIKRLQNSTTFDRKLTKEYRRETESEKLITHQEIDPNLILENLSLKSGHFRHAVRITVALLVGYTASLFFQFGHGYWILLTIITIIKPAYSITRSRNMKRIGGTMAGGILGFLVLYFIKDSAWLFAIMVIAMIVSYSLLKQNYFVSTTGITLYVLISIHFLSHANFARVLTDRIIDTAIGSVIAYLVSLWVLPTWEHEQIGEYILEALKANRKYFGEAAKIFTGEEVDLVSFKSGRKEAFVALANLGDVFQRMLSEPKSKQVGMEYYHQFTSSSHMLTSYIASLSYYAQQKGKQYASHEFKPLIEQIDRQFQAAIDLYEHHLKVAQVSVINAYPISNRIQELLKARREEMHTGQKDESQSVRKVLSDLKTIANQIELISTITIDEIRILEHLAA